MCARPTVEIDGSAAAADDLVTLLMTQYGHSTAMQVRDRCVQGLGRHLERLKHANQELFGVEMSSERILSYVLHGLTGRDDATVKVYVYQPDSVYDPVVLVWVGAPAPTASKPRALMSVRYQRPQPHLKHIGTFGKLHAVRRAHAEGFDSVLLLTSDGFVAEGATTNLVVYDGECAVWPSSPMLVGVTMQIIQDRLDVLGAPSRTAAIHIDDLDRMTGVFVMNSRGVAPVSRIDSKDIPLNKRALDGLTFALADAPWEPLDISHSA